MVTAVRECSCRSVILVSVTTIDLGGYSTRDLLALYGAIIDELLRRHVVRTRNAPAGDYGEWLVARALNGTLEPNSAKSWDVRTPGGERVQVKTRVVGPDTRGSAAWSVFRTFDFDSAVFIRLTRGSYAVERAVKVPSAALPPASRYSAHVAGHLVRLRTRLLDLSGAVDITDAIRAAADTKAPPPVDLGGSTVTAASAGGQTDIGGPAGA